DDNSRGRGSPLLERLHGTDINAGTLELGPDLDRRIVVADAAPKLGLAAEASDRCCSVGRHAATALHMLQRADFRRFPRKRFDPVDVIERGVADADDPLHGAISSIDQVTFPISQQKFISASYIVRLNAGRASKSARKLCL